MSKTTKCPNCRRLAALNRELKGQVARLEDELRRAHRQAAPFGKGPGSEKPKRPGRKKGQGVFAHRKPPPLEETEDVHVPLDRCPRCGGPLSEKQTHEHIQTDIPIPQPKHTRFINESGYCVHCKKRYRSRHPQQSSTAAGAASASIGPNAQAIAADLHHRTGVPYAKIADHLHAVSGITVTASGLCQASSRLAAKLEPVYAELIAMIRQACAVHADETGWRIGTLSAWLWVFTSRQVTIYVIDPSRAHEVVLEILGRQFHGTLVSDCFVAYDHKALAEWIKQKCYAHLLKDLKAMEAVKTRGAIRFPRAVKRVLKDALQLAEEKPALSPEAFSRRLARIERRIDSLIDARRRFSDPDNARFAKRLRKQRQHLFTFLTHDGVEPTNNAGERMIRPAVIVRKTGACNKTPKGARSHGVIASILNSAKQNAIDGIAYLVDSITAPAQPPRLPIPVTDSS